MQNRGQMNVIPSDPPPAGGFIAIAAGVASAVCLFFSCGKRPVQEVEDDGARDGFRLRLTDSGMASDNLNADAEQVSETSVDAEADAAYGLRHEEKTRGVLPQDTGDEIKGENPSYSGMDWERRVHERRIALAQDEDEQRRADEHLSTLIKQYPSEQLPINQIIGQFDSERKERNLPPYPISSSMAIKMGLIK